MTIFGIAGSLRSKSFNRGLLEYAAKTASKGVIIDMFEDLDQIPPFNQDQEQHIPNVIKKFKQRIEKSDAVLFSTPEYNFSVPGVLKNAIDWASRPYGNNSFDDKPAAIMSASGGMLGGARAQYALRKIFVFLNIHPLNKPEVMVPFAAQKFDEQGNLIDIHTQEKVKELVIGLADWTRRIQLQQVQQTQRTYSVH